jgi:hypothetical protein
MRALLLLALVSCGGAPFTLADGLPLMDAAPDAGHEAVDAPREAVDKLPAPHPDAQPEAAEASEAEAGFDATPDGSSPDGSTPEAEAGPLEAGCAPAPTSMFRCGSNSASASAPTQYCHNTNNYNGMGAAFGTPTPMPLECQCVGAYNCRCLTAVLTRAQLCGGLNYAGCNDTQSGAVNGINVGCL